MNRDVRELIDNAEEITIDRVRFEHVMPGLGFTSRNELGAVTRLRMRIN